MGWCDEMQGWLVGVAGLGRAGGARGWVDWWFGPVEIASVGASGVAIAYDPGPHFVLVAWLGRKRTLTQMKEGDAHGCTQMGPCGSQAVG
jgi:hypothetical protein